MGHRGTGKSTAVRALADLLPPVWVVRGCPFNCDPDEEAEHCADCDSRLRKEGKLTRVRVVVPVVDMPLGATEDRVTGSINIERALTAGVKAFELGLLARANRGFLYIDEVNLLEDHLVDLLLDVSVTGRNVVEREGISIKHPARFVLVGSGNPEEGELRPQLQDRFGLCVEVTTLEDVGERVRVVELMEEFERDSERLRETFGKEQESLRRRITRARNNFPKITISSKILRKIAELCQRLGVHGHRGEITIARAARALAAFEGRREVTANDVQRVAAMSLRHRLRRDPMERSGGGSARIENELERVFHQDSERNEMGERERVENKRSLRERNESSGDVENSVKSSSRNRESKDAASNGKEQSAPIEEFSGEFQETILEKNSLAQRKQSLGRKSRRPAQARQSVDDRRGGRYARAISRKPVHARLALDATARAFAATITETTFHMPDEDKRLLLVPLSALRYKQFRRKVGTLFIFALDASGSMALNRIRQAKGALLKLLKKSYVARDRVAIVSFRGEGADVLLGPSQSITRARNVLDSLPVGGATPLSAGLHASLQIASRASQRCAQKIVLLLFTDGRANVPMRGAHVTSRDERSVRIDEEIVELGCALRKAGVSVVLVDTNSKLVKNHEAENLAEKLQAKYIQLPSAISSGEQSFPRINLGVTQLRGERRKSQYRLR